MSRQGNLDVGRGFRRAIGTNPESEGPRMLDFMEAANRKETVFDFKRHRAIEHYGRITAPVGVIELP